MKKAIVATLLLGFVLSFQSCIEDKCSELHTFYIFEPVYLTESELHSDFELQSPRDLKNPGKMYFYENMIFINEKYEGVHVYDNVDPSNPTNLGFISIPGNTDVVVKDDILYAGGVIDIFSLNIQNVQQPVLINTVEDIYKDVPFDETLGYIAYYNPVEQREEYDCTNNLSWLENGFIALTETEFPIEFDANSSIPNTGVPTGQAGIGGSTARMTITGNHLYLVDDHNLTSMSIANPGFPVVTSEQNVGWGIETIYPYQENLFIGSSTGMFIYDNTNPDEPVLLSSFQHWRACDPVVVENNTAYVTLRDGNACQGFTNQLEVINVSDLENPFLIKTFQMTNPHGLAIRNNSLFICEGNDGLKIFDAANSQSIDQNLLYHDPSFHATDVISLNENLVFVIGSDGFRQMDVSEKNTPHVISTIPVIQ